MGASDASRLRALAPAVVETLTFGLAFGLLAPLTFAIAVAGEGLRLTAVDVGLVVALGAVLLWLLRLQLRSRIAPAPPVPPEAQVDADRATVWRGARIGLLPAALLALSAEYGGGFEALLCLMASVVLVSNAFRLKRWERRTGKRIYRERRFWARHAPRFYLGSLDQHRRVPQGAD